jgi:hypothetical protein
MSGYSGKQLFLKLSLKETYRVRLINPPVNYFDLLQAPFDFARAKKSEKADFIHCFVKSIDDLEKLFPQLKNDIQNNGMIWISWYKKSSGIETDVTENSIRELALENGLVDVKVCAIDDQWSGLKLVYRLKDR